MVKSLLFGLTVGSVGTLVAMQYHLVRTDERFVIVSRAHQPPLRSAYVDIRDWSPAMWQHYPELKEAIVKAGREDLLMERSQAAANLEDALPFQGVSRMGETPIFTASDARNTPVSTRSPATEQGLPPEAFHSGLSPRIALGTPAEKMSPVEPPSHSTPNSTLTDLPATAEALLHSMQRTVPQPEEIAPPASVSRIVPPERGHAPAAGKAATETPEAPVESSKRDWMQSLLRTIVPGAAATTSPAQAPSQAQASADEELPSPVIRQERTIVPEQSIPQTPPAFKIVPRTEDNTFPVTPRRIFTTSVREI